jgi:hypothetical protein
MRPRPPSAHAAQSTAKRPSTPRSPSGQNEIDYLACLALWRFALRFCYAVLALVGCTVDRTLPEPTQLACEADGACPDGFTCVDSALCVAESSPCMQPAGESFQPIADGTPCGNVTDGVCLRGLCRTSRCGDGFADLVRREECDDGNFENDDACLTGCLRARCGDHLLQVGVESCEGDVANGQCLQCVARCNQRWGNCNADWSDGCECEAEILATFEEAMWALAQDEDYLYASVAAYSSPLNGTITRVAKADGVTLDLATDVMWAHDLEVDATHVYWMSYDFDLGMGNIARVPKGGGEIEPLVEPRDMDLSFTLDATHLYFASDHDIMRMPKDGATAPTSLGGDAWVTELVTGGGYLYWTDGIDGRVYRLPTTGGERTAPVQRRPSLTGLALDGERLAWSQLSTAEGEDEPNGTIGVTTLGAEPIELELAGGLVEPYDVALAGDDVYFSDRDLGAVWRVDAAGGEPTLVVEVIDAGTLLVDAGHLYVDRGYLLLAVAR